MGILGFGRAKRLEDLKMGELRKERAVQEVEQDKQLRGIKRLQEEYDRRLGLASDPGVGSAERDVHAYQMSIASKRKTRSEADLQRTITRMAALDAAMDVLRMKRELEKRGVWKRINELDEEALEDQLDAIAVSTKESGNKLETIVRMLEPDADDVKFERGAEFDRARAEIELAAREKAEGDGVGSRV